MESKLSFIQSGKGTITDEEGVFDLILPKSLPDTIVFFARGYISDTVIVTKEDRFLALNVVLYSDQLLPEVIVEYKRKSYSISRLKVLHVEELTSSELKKGCLLQLGRVL